MRWSKRARLFLLMDDHSRFVIHGRWYDNETLRAGQEVLRCGIVRYGLPASLYVDNGSAYSGHQLRLTCAVLGIRLIHTRPRQPQGRGKLERLFRLVREHFLLEAEKAGIATLKELNWRFWAWVESYLNERIHSETHEPPKARYEKAEPRRPEPRLLEQAFAWVDRRRVSKTATISFHGGQYETDPALVGKRVEIRYLPEDLTRLEVFLEGRSHGYAVPRRIGRHVHPKVPKAPPVPKPTGIDYLGAVLRQHDRRRAQGARPINYRDLNRKRESGS